MTLVLALIFGLAFGSFAAAAIDRLPRGVSLAGRSRCDACGKVLAAAELVPVVSYLLLRGHCADCHAPIGARSTLIEVASALTFGAAFVALPAAAAATACGAFVMLVITGGVAAARRKSIS